MKNGRVSECIFRALKHRDDAYVYLKLYKQQKKEKEKIGLGCLKILQNAEMKRCFLDG